MDEIGAIGERIVAEQYRLDVVPFETDPNAQRQGTDGTRGMLKLQVKTRGPDTVKYWNGGPDILIETVSVVEMKKAGWIYASQADILLYGVLNKTLNDFAFLWWFKFDKLREWWARQNAGKYEPKTATTEDGWTTENRVVPLADIPRHIYRDERPKVRLMRNPVKAYNEVYREWQREQRGAMT